MKAKKRAPFGTHPQTFQIVSEYLSNHIRALAPRRKGWKTRSIRSKNKKQLDIPQFPKNMSKLPIPDMNCGKLPASPRIVNWFAPNYYKM
jgi:hypothetical protein